MPSRSVFLLVAAAALPAQTPHWQLPAHGVVHFHEEGRLRGQRQDGSGIQPFDSIGSRCHPLLFADEFVDDGRRWLTTPFSLESVPVWLACDLTTKAAAGPIRHVWPRLAPFGEVSFVGHSGPLAGDGWQQLEGRLTRNPVRARRGAEREVELDRHYMANELDAQLVVRRQFDASGLLQTIEWTLAGGITGDNPPIPIQVSGGRTWRRIEVLGNRFAAAAEPGFAERVQAAAERCRARLLADVRAEAGAIGAAAGRGNLHGPSLHAADLYGLARAGLRAGEPTVDAALQQLLRRDPTQVQGRAFTILAIATLHAPSGNREAARIVLPAPLRTTIVQQVSALLAARRPGPDGAPTWWSFADDVVTRSLFHSCVSVQALDAAERCGVAVPKQAFEAFARHLLATAIHDQAMPPVRLTREPADQPAANVAGTRTAPPGQNVPRACSWNDAGSDSFRSHGADTAWAMAALLACARHVEDPQLRRACRDTAERGWAWLHHHHTARHCPASMSVLRQYRHSFVHALAWLLDESGVRWVDEHDLYFEVASVLLADTVDGIVRSTVVDTAAALTFWRTLPTTATSGTPGTGSR